MIKKIVLIFHYLRYILLFKIIFFSNLNNETMKDMYTCFRFMMLEYSLLVWLEEEEFLDVVQLVISLFFIAYELQYI